MPEKVEAQVIWEDNPDTPIDASGLSSSFDYQSQSKFIYYTDAPEDYIDWADFIRTGLTWPVEGDPDWNDDYVGATVYNTDTQEARTAYYGAGNLVEWEDLASPYKKILKILSGTKITASYIKEATDELQYESFQFNEDQIFSVDDLLEDDDFDSDSFYSIYLYHRYMYGDIAHIKIINSVYDIATGDGSWKRMGVNAVSPSGYNVISYRKIGGFQTDTNGHIIEETVWDLSTYRTELTVEKLKIDTSGIVEEIEAKHIPIQSVSGDVQFNAGDVQAALVENRSVLNTLSSSFYTNRRGSFNLRFAFGRKATPQSSLVPLSANQISLVISAGYIDVAGSEVVFENDVYLANDEVEINVNDGDWYDDITLGAQLVNSSGHDKKIYAGIWRVFIDEVGRILVKEQGEDAPVWIKDRAGWYDPVNGSRCIGKFRVSNAGAVYYIDKMSVTETLDFDPPVGTLFHFHGTLCPDGLLPCDGKWHDVTGIDQDAYTLANLPDISLWGDSWYEETPDLMNEGRTLRSGIQHPVNNSGGQFDISTGQGGSIDVGAENGSEEHFHLFEHNHGKGTLAIIASGEHQHSGDIQVAAAGVDQQVQVDPVVSGTAVTTGGHIHAITTSLSGEHLHSNDEFQGSTSTITGQSAQTDANSSWPPYKEVLICIKK